MDILIGLENVICHAKLVVSRGLDNFIDACHCSDNDMLFSVNMSRRNRNKIGVSPKIFDYLLQYRASF